MSTPIQDVTAIAASTPSEGALIQGILGGLFVNFLALTHLLSADERAALARVGEEAALGEGNRLIAADQLSDVAATLLTISAFNTHVGNETTDVKHVTDAMLAALAGMGWWDALSAANPVASQAEILELWDYMGLPWCGTPSGNPWTEGGLAAIRTGGGSINIIFTGSVVTSIELWIALDSGEGADKWKRLPLMDDLGTAAFTAATDYATAEQGAKADSAVQASTLTANRVAITDGDALLASSAVTNTELGYVSGVTSAIQTQFDNEATARATGDSVLTPNSLSAAYTLVLTDAGKALVHPEADTTARTWTIPANASVAFAVGTVLTIANTYGAGILSLGITTDTLYLAGSSLTGTRSISSGGLATLIKVGDTTWMVSGAGVS